VGWKLLATAVWIISGAILHNAAGDRLSSLVRQVGEVNTRSWAYGYDQLSRLVTAERGTLLADHSGLDHYTATVAERTSWGLDTLGNWTEPSGLNGSYAGRVAEAFESGTGEYSLLLEEQAHTTDQRNRLGCSRTRSWGRRCRWGRRPGAGTRPTPNGSMCVGGP
jgi:hypothetical protein